MKKIPLSKEKLRALKEELKVMEKRNKALAKEAGDEYSGSFRDAASTDTQRQQFKKRVAELQKIIKMAVELPKESKSKTCVIGSYTTIETGNGKEIYRLVHPLEADPQKNLISVESPFGEKLLGRKDGDSIEVGSGVKYTILSVN